MLGQLKLYFSMSKNWPIISYTHSFGLLLDIEISNRAPELKAGQTGMDEGYMPKKDTMQQNETNQNHLAS
jgi:hypothetical protein